MFGLSESQIVRRVKAIAKAAGLADWEFFSGHSGRGDMARRRAQNGAPIHEIEARATGNRAAAWSAATLAASPQGRRCGACSSGLWGQTDLHSGLATTLLLLLTLERRTLTVVGLSRDGVIH